MSGWGGARHATWTPAAPPVVRRAVLAAALAVGLGVAVGGYVVVWTPLQRRYFVTYVRSGLVWPTSGEFALLHVVDARGSRIALDEELVSVASATGDATFALAEDASKAGATRIEWRRERYAHAALHPFLRRWIYRDQTLLDLATPPLWTALVLFVGGALGARLQGSVDARRARDPYPRWDTRLPTPPVVPVVIEPVRDLSHAQPSSLAVTHQPAAGPSVSLPSPPASSSAPFFQ